MHDADKIPGEDLFIHLVDTKELLQASLTFSLCRCRLEADFKVGRCLCEIDSNSKSSVTNIL